MQIDSTISDESSKRRAFLGYVDEMLKDPNGPFKQMFQTLNQTGKPFQPFLACGNGQENPILGFTVIDRDDAIILDRVLADYFKNLKGTDQKKFGSISAHHDWKAETGCQMDVTFYKAPVSCQILTSEQFNNGDHQLVRTLGKYPKLRK